MDFARNLLLVLHILSAVFWLSGLVADIALNLLVKSNGERQQQLAFHLARIRINRLGGAVGGAGLLITGFGLIGVDGYGFLGLINPTPTWLFLKQALYLIAFVVVIVLLNPISRKLSGILANAADNGDMAQVRDILPRLNWYARLGYLLVILNIVLAVWKMPA